MNFIRPNKRKEDAQKNSELCPRNRRAEDVEAENLMFVSFYSDNETLFHFSSISCSSITSRLLLGRLKKISQIGSSLYFVLIQNSKSNKNKEVNDV